MSGLRVQNEAAESRVWGRAARRIAAGVAACACVAGVAAVASSTERAAAGAAQRPNVVVVMTDDQTVAALRAMPRTTALIGAQGATFANSFVSYPLCCPSRATFLTGQYAHNHGVNNNGPPGGGFDRLDNSETLAIWLQRAGYYTAQVGKVLNGYETSAVGVPPGWSEWHGLKTENAYYGYQLLENGRLNTYGNPNENPDEPADEDSYATDVFTDKAVEMIGRLAPSASPFFLWVSYNAPHSGKPDPPLTQLPTSQCRGNAKPAARHLGAYANEPLPTPASFDEPDVGDKPPSVRSLPRFTPASVAAITRIYRCELEALRAVDEGVDRIVGALAASGELAQTAVVFTSDNGFFHGEHRLPFGKHLPYEEALRVPLLVRGPGIEPGSRVSELALNVDLAPTILDFANARPGLPQDGRSLLPIADRPNLDRGRELLIDTNRYEGVRTPRFVYARYTGGPDAGARELYDLEKDPLQLNSVHKQRRYRDVLKALEKRLRVLRKCDGEECRTPPRLKLRREAPARRAPRRPCGPPTVTVLLDGRDAGSVREATFFVGASRLRSDRYEPFRARIPAGRLGGGKVVRAEATMVDGRELSVRRKLKRCP